MRFWRLLAFPTAKPSRRPGAARSYSPTIDPANFVTTIDNRYFPLMPGTGFHYKGVAENGTTRRPTTWS